jgi:hypothetical protein
MTFLAKVELMAEARLYREVIEWRCSKKNEFPSQSRTAVMMRSVSVAELFKLPQAAASYSNQPRV